MKHRKKGFTIVELLVVISIIGLLASIAAVLLTNARKQARDNRRIEDLKQMQTALELYFKDNKAYPLSANGDGFWAGHCKDRNGKWGTPDPLDNDEKYIPELLALPEQYMAKLPLDPRFDVDGVTGPPRVNPQCYIYQSKNDGGVWRYKIVAKNVMESICGGDPSDSCNPQYIQALDDPKNTSPSISVYSDSVSKDWGQ